MLRGLEAPERREVLYLVLFPNVLLSLHPDYVMTPPPHTARARPHPGPLQLVVLPRGPRASPGSTPSFAVDFWDITNRQDWSACESVQRGLASEHWVPGHLAPDEDGVYQFVTMVARAYQGLPLRAGVVRRPLTPG